MVLPFSPHGLRVQVTVRRVDNSFWRLFREHHYKSGILQPGSECYVAFLGPEPVAFLAMFMHVGTAMNLPGSDQKVPVTEDRAAENSFVPM